jgi:hypothetical protein
LKVQCTPSIDLKYDPEKNPIIDPSTNKKIEKVTEEFEVNDIRGKIDHIRANYHLSEQLPATPGMPKAFVYNLHTALLVQELRCANRGDGYDQY